MPAVSDACAARGTFREALECGGDRATALGGRRNATYPQRLMRARAKHHTLRVLTIPPPSQSGDLVTALQSAAHENVFVLRGHTPRCCATFVREPPRRP